MKTFFSTGPGSYKAIARTILYALLALLTVACAARPLQMAPCQAATPPPAVDGATPRLPDRYCPAPADIRTMLRYLVEDGETPGIVLGLVEVDGSTHVYHYGDAGPGARPLGPQSVFELGSITKTRPAK